MLIRVKKVTFQRNTLNTKTTERMENVVLLEFFLNGFHWVQGIQWIVTKSKSDMLTKVVTYLATGTLPVLDTNLQIVVENSFPRPHQVMYLLLDIECLWQPYCSWIWSWFTEFAEFRESHLGKALFYFREKWLFNSVRWPVECSPWLVIVTSVPTFVSTGVTGVELCVFQFKELNSIYSYRHCHCVYDYHFFYGMNKNGHLRFPKMVTEPILTIPILQYKGISMAHTMVIAIGQLMPSVNWPLSSELLT